MTEPWAPYRPPVRAPRGWRVGPLQVDAGLAAGDCAGLAADVRVDQSVLMDLATGDGAGLAGDVAITTFVDVNISMLLAACDGAGLAADASVDQSITMNLADGSGGTALAPTLTVVSPITFGALGAGDEPFVNPGTTITASWSHTKLTADNIALVAVCGATGQQRSALTVSATYGGVAMTSQGASASYFYSVNSTYSWVEWFYLLSPGTGAKTVTATATGSSQPLILSCNSLTYSNVSSASGFVAVGNVSGTAISQGVSSAVNRRVVCASSSYNSAHITNQTVRDTGFGSTQRSIADAPGAASVTFTGDNPGSGVPWCTAAIELL